MQNDDELVENIARRAFEARTGVAKACGMKVFSWDERTPIMKDAERAAARAALQVVKEEGWTPPISALDIAKGGAAYRVTFSPQGRVVCEPVDLYDNKNPANREARGERIE